MADPRRRKTDIERSTGDFSADAVRHFTAAWDRSDRPPVLEYLGSSCGAQRASLAADLIRVDLERRSQLGEDVCVDTYLRDVPELRDADVELVALILDEHSIRTASGEVVAIDEYARRFPEHLETLRNELGLTDDGTRCPSLVNVESGGSPANHDASNHDASNDDIQPGQVFGDFRVERLLGAGGVSRVFLATQLSLDRKVALKVTVESEDEAAGANEGRTMAALSHPDIVPVFAEERVGRLRLLAMEYVDGPALSEFLKAARARFHESESRRLPSAVDAVALIAECCSNQSETVDADQRDDGSSNAVLHPESNAGSGREDSGSYRDFACRVARDLANALAAASREGVQHSDVKPANVLLTRDGKALLADFNVSVRRAAINSEADPLPVGGTLLYMSPEQLGILTGSGTVNRVDQRSDIYSLGLVLFELLTGRWPFAESNIAADPLTAAGQLQASRLSTAIEFPQRSEWLTPGLESIIQKCLTPQPDDRYQDAGELADDLDRFLNHRPLHVAADPSWKERVSKWVKRSPSRAILVGSLVVALSVLLVISRRDDGARRVSISGAGMVAASGTVSPAAHEEAATRAREIDLAGQRLLSGGNFQAAEQQFEIATKLNPQLATAWHNLGVARFRLGQFSDSLSAFDRSVALGNESGRAYSHRAAARFALGDEPGAEADFATALKVASFQEKDEVLANQQEFETRRALDKSATGRASP